MVFFIFQFLIMTALYYILKQGTLTSIFLVCENRHPSSENSHFSLINIVSEILKPNIDIEFYFADFWWLDGLVYSQFCFLCIWTNII